MIQLIKSIRVNKLEVLSEFSNYNNKNTMSAPLTCQFTGSYICYRTR